MKYRCIVIVLRARFSICKCNRLKIELEIYLLQILSNHPETIRIYSTSKDHLKYIYPTKFGLGLKTKNFLIFRPPKIVKKGQVPYFQNPIFSVVNVWPKSKFRWTDLF